MIGALWVRNARGKREDARAQTDIMDVCVYIRQCAPREPSRERRMLSVYPAPPPFSRARAVVRTVTMPALPAVGCWRYIIYMQRCAGVGFSPVVQAIWGCFVAVFGVT